MEVVSNLQDPSLFDVSVSATIEQGELAPQDMMTCEVTIVNTEFVKRVEKSILEELVSATKSDLEVTLIAAHCYSSGNEIEDNNEPVDYEAVENTLEVGAAVETFSEEAASYLESSSYPHGLNVLLVGLLSAICLQWAL